LSWYFTGEQRVTGCAYRKTINAYKNTFSPKHLNWNAEINNTVVNYFIDKEFDLLISYYDIEKQFY
jgi:hypothetical protein